MIDGFAVFILTHGRPNNVKTYRTLRRCGYDGPIFLVCDDEDKTLDFYRQKYGDEVLVFSKDETRAMFDMGDNLNSKKCVVYARNACFEVARRVGAKYFLVLDDDYTAFSYRFNDKLEYKHKPIKDLQRVLYAMLEFFINTPMLTLCMAQGGDYIGGGQGMFGKKVFLRRKAMNAFICSVDRPFTFDGTINEDVNAYVRHGNVGGLLYTTNLVSLNQVATQTNNSGLTDIYLELGTYVKSFYSVLFVPSAVRVSMMGNKHRRIHHEINWRYCVPKVLSEKHRKLQNDGKTSNNPD